MKTKYSVRSCTALAFLFALFGTSCSGAKPIPVDSDASRPDWGSPVANDPPSKSRTSAIWSKKLKGYVSDLAVSGDGKALLVSTLPNYDRDDGDRRSFLHYFSAASGKQLWRRELSTQAKSQAISLDGSLALVATYDNELIAYNSKGKKLWVAESSCSPIVLEKSKKILCYHDDDPEPGVAFDVLSWQGKRLSSYPIKGDILALKTDATDGSVAFALTGGRVIELGPDLKLKWEAKVQGEISDLDISGVKVAVLYGARPGVEKIAVFSEGLKLADATPAGHVDQVLFAPDARSLYAYGNGESGQYVSEFADGHELWRRGAKQNAHYLTGIAADQGVIFGFENVQGASRKSLAIELGHSGQVDRMIPLASGEGVYLYILAYAPATRSLVLATDDGGVFSYRLVK